VRRGRTTTGRGVGLGATLTTVRLGATLTGVRTGGHPTSSRSWSPSHRCGVGSELAIAVLEATTPGAATLRQSTPARIHRLMVVPPLCLTLSSQRQPKFYQFVTRQTLTSCSGRSRWLPQWGSDAWARSSGHPRAASVS
jgi:hypothetical protein